MKISDARWAAAFLMIFSIHAPAATLYVSLTSTNPVPPYASWNTAANNIQDAVDTSSDGDLILVTNGMYQTGGRTADGYALTNRVVIDKTVMVQSVNGPTATFIQGYQMPGTINGSNAVRCVYMADNALLSGFTITRGATWNLIDVLAPQDESGGGIWCASSNAVVSNCVIVANSCLMFGAGVYSGTLENCQLNNNTNQNVSLGGGGGAASSTLLGCAIEGNWMQPGCRGGGVISCTLSNCLLTGNSDDGAFGSTLNDCILSNNISGYYAGGADQSILNNCLVCNNQGGQGGGGGAYNCLLNFCTISNNLTGGDGGGAYYDDSNINAPGQSNIIVGNIATNFSNRTGGGVFSVINLNLNGWIFISNSAAGDGGGLYLDSARSTLNGCIFLGNSSGGSGGGFCGPYLSLVAASNCTFVGNVATGNGGGACNAALNACSVLGNKAGNGGGVYGTVQNSTVNNNTATSSGGGMYEFVNGFLLYANCTFSNNSALNGGGVFVPSTYQFVSLSNCVFLGNSATNTGGGVSGGRLSSCIISDNTTGGNGGGAYNSPSIANCLLAGNSAGTNGGGIYSDTIAPAVTSSTIVSNSAVAAGGGVHLQLSAVFGVSNSIIYDNSAPVNMNYVGGVWNYSCTTPLPTLLGSKNNITNDPAFVNLAAGNFRLQSNSPCINSGNNAYVTSDTDLDGNPRIVGNTVDIGAYEYQTPTSVISYAWLQQYGLPINTNTDTADFDHDGLNNYQEWIAGTNPTNALSVLEMLSPIPTNDPSGLVLGWESVNNRTYFLQSSTNLGMQPAFSTIQSNILGQTGTTSYTDTTATNSGPFFYRVGVQQ